MWILLLAACSVGPPAHDGVLTGDDPDRPAPVLLPDGDGPWPLVLLLGGYDYFSADLDDWIGVSQRVDQGFALVMPDGTVDAWGSPFWNATDTCCDYGETGIDDAGYLASLIAEAEATLPIDPDRTIVVGHSNGAFMGFGLACLPDGPIEALVSLAGSSFLDASLCEATRPISILQVHGDLDDVMPIGGDDEAPGARTVLDRWATRADCDVDAWGTDGDALDLLDDQAGADTSVSTYAGGCASGDDLRLWTLHGADHYPALSAEFTDRALRWAGAMP